MLAPLDLFCGSDVLCDTTVVLPKVSHWNHQVGDGYISPTVLRQHHDSSTQFLAESNQAAPRELLYSVILCFYR